MLRLLVATLAIGMTFVTKAETTSIDWSFNIGNSGVYSEDPNLVSNNSNVHSFVEGTDNSSNWWHDNDFTSITFIEGGMKVQMTGWSDSDPMVENGSTPTSGQGQYDQTVNQGELYYWGASNGWGIVNSDENPEDVPDHSIDNYSAHGDTWSDLDMVLLAFDEAVSLEGITAGWVTNSNNPASLDNVGAVAVNQQSINAMNSGTATWNDVFNSADLSAVSYSSTNNNDEHYYSLPQGSGTSKFWLVGLYNEMENCDHDGFKLMGVTASTGTVTDVPEPSSFAILLVALAMVYRQRQNNSEIKLNL